MNQPIEEDFEELGDPSGQCGRTTEIVCTETLPMGRMDSYLTKIYPKVSRGTFKRLIDESLVLVNGLAIKPTHTPKAGDSVHISWPIPKPSVALAEEMSLDILFEDADILVVNKASGLVTHPSIGHATGTLVNGLLHHCQGQLSGIGGVIRPGIVHRLDKDTSGCIVVAKNDAAHIALADQFAHRTVQKVYHTITCGIIAQATGQIRVNIGRHPHHRKRMTTLAGNAGREAWTSFRTIERLSKATFVEIMLHTGRTHQIRVHFDHLGHPVVGDGTYGIRQNRLFIRETGFTANRQMLHASKISFTHPVNQKLLICQAHLPTDFQFALTKLK